MPKKIVSIVKYLLQKKISPGCNLVKASHSWSPDSRGEPEEGMEYQEPSSLEAVSRMDSPLFLFVNVVGCRNPCSSVVPIYWAMSPSFYWAAHSNSLPESALVIAVLSSLMSGRGSWPP